MPRGKDIMLGGLLLWLRSDRGVFGSITNATSAVQKAKTKANSWMMGFLCRLDMILSTHSLALFEPSKIDLIFPCVARGVIWTAVQGRSGRVPRPFWGRAGPRGRREPLRSCGPRKGGRLARGASRPAPPLFPRAALPGARRTLPSSLWTLRRPAKITKESGRRMARRRGRSDLSAGSAGRRPINIAPDARAVPRAGPTAPATARTGAPAQAPRRAACGRCYPKTHVDGVGGPRPPAPGPLPPPAEGPREEPAGAGGLSIVRRKRGPVLDPGHPKKKKVK